MTDFDKDDTHDNYENNEMVFVIMSCRCLNRIPLLMLCKRLWGMINALNKLQTNVIFISSQNQAVSVQISQSLLASLLASAQEAHWRPLLLAQRQRCQADLITPQLAADVLNCSPLFLFHFHPLESTPPFHSNHRSTGRFFKATLSNIFYG